MSSTTNLLLKLYVVLWIVNTLTIACETSCLQSTVSATKLSCFSATLQSLWINVSTSVLLEVVDSNWKILSLEKCTSSRCVSCTVRIMILSSILLTCIAEHVLVFSLTLWTNVFSASLITHVYQWVSSCSLLSTCSAKYLFILILWTNVFSTSLITCIQYSSLISTNIKLFKLSILVSFRCRVSSKWFAERYSHSYSQIILMMHWLNLSFLIYVLFQSCRSTISWFIWLVFRLAFECS